MSDQDRTIPERPRDLHDRVKANHDRILEMLVNGEMDASGRVVEDDEQRLGWRTW